MIAKIKTKMKFLPTVEWGQVLNVPTIVESPVSFELEVKKQSLWEMDQIFFSV